MTRIALLHAYDARNRGDGALVEAAVRVVRDALGPATRVDVVALAPDSIAGLADRAVSARREVLAGLAGRGLVLGRLATYDLVVGVGGGYLRGRRPVEFIKMALVHIPQLWAAARTPTPTIYLPQSIGPFLGGTTGAIRGLLGQLNSVSVRDDLSWAVMRKSADRLPDLVLLDMGEVAWRDDAAIQRAAPVVGVRALRRRVPTRVRDLIEGMGAFDVFVQSATRHNDDTAVTSQLASDRQIAADELFADDGPARVVVSMRLHGALMALAAGHYVIHLAYERKGFGAFTDAGLAQFVHSANRLDPERVLAQVRLLQSSPDARASYRSRLAATAPARAEDRALLVGRIRDLVQGPRGRTRS